MQRTHRVWVAVCAGLVLVLAGCVGARSPGGTNASAATAADSNAVTTPHCVRGLSFSPVGTGLFASDRVGVGYRMVGPGSAFLVVYENETVLGIDHVRMSSNGTIFADGDVVHLDGRLRGTHTLRVVAYDDTNRNGEFDPSIDDPCRYRGAVVGAGPEPFDFSDTGIATTESGT